ncbi:hypothetical protein Dimus_023143, partial [Dionaea muscipula]
LGYCSPAPCKAARELHHRRARSSPEKECSATWKEARSSPTLHKASCPRVLLVGSSCIADARQFLMLLAGSSSCMEP